MAGWSIPTTNESFATDLCEILQTLQRHGFCLNIAYPINLGFDGKIDDIKIGSIFYHILCVFLKEVSPIHSIRPLPAMVGDGKCVDLFKLFFIVMEKGGYDLVSKKTGLWSLISEDIGLDSSFAIAVKLIYIKYLDTLDRWLRGKGFGGEKQLGLVDNGGNFGMLSIGLETQKPDYLLPNTISNHDHKKQGPGVVGSRMRSEENVVYKRNSKKRHAVSDEKVVRTSSREEDCSSRKRKQEKLKLSEPYGDGNVGGQVLKAQDPLLHAKKFYSAAHSPLLKNKQMLPSIHEDIDANQLSTERLICSKRVLPLMKSDYESLETNQTDLDIHHPKSSMGFKEKHTKQLSETADSLLLERGDYLIHKTYVVKSVAVGKLHQAEVPKWTGMNSKSNSKWLGTRIWPLKTVDKSHSNIERVPIGKGRPDSCGCRIRGSVECVRFHIIEQRMRLKVELGSAFNRWKLSCMGEEASLAWKDEEEEKFMAIARQNRRSLNNSFWNQALKSFPSKRRHELVSYYFNVYVLRRRSYQNRVSPRNIDSDDD